MLVLVPDRVLLLGLMGTGKTTVGRRLAERLGVPFLDNDDLVHEATGRERAELLHAEGEAGLRAAESAALGAALDRSGPLVANVAAGVVLDEGDRRRLRDTDDLVVWLRARPETLADRTAADRERETRPWLGHDPVETFRAMAHDRDRWYAEVADVVIDVDDLTPDEVANRIAAR